MIIHHLRNATLILQWDNYSLLIDPMLGPAGSLPPFAFIRHKARKNPTVSLPENSDQILGSATHALITHLHPDHLDSAGEQFLKKVKLPTGCSVHDTQILEDKGLNLLQAFNYWKPTPFMGGTVTGIPARHGYGFIARPMGNVMGFYMEFPGQPSIYISSDTIYTEDVHKVLTEYKPDISVLAAGLAQFDLFRPLLMNQQDILKFMKNATGIVMANHLESINHCGMTRANLASLMKKHGLINKIWVPEDGDSREFNR